MVVRFPARAQDITPGLLTELISAQHPGVVVEDVAVTDEWTYGLGQVSAAARLGLTVRYGGDRAGLPERLIVKIDRRNNSPYPLYANEVEIYSRLRPGRIVNVPAFLGGAYDPESGSLGLLLEDLRVRSVTFPNVLLPVTLDDLRAVIDQVARLHAAFWCSPRLTSDLSWLQSHITGDIHSLYTDPDKRPAIIAHQLETTQFKREMVQRLRTSGPELARLTAVAQRHQSTLPQTVVHGDAHIGNTFLIPDGGAGLVDWQLCVRGFVMHDVTYLLLTSLPVADRRAHERELIAYYADRLREYGVTEPPALESLWTEYRRAAVWCLYIGWLTVPVVNYGWEITIGNHLRITTAMEDLQTLTELRRLAAG
jgi:thiamine kinase-like enzyme